jgi:hypothetical protein
MLAHPAAAAQSKSVPRPRMAIELSIPKLLQRRLAAATVAHDRSRVRD